VNYGLRYYEYLRAYENTMAMRSSSNLYFGSGRNKPVRPTAENAQMQRDAKQPIGELCENSGTGNGGRAWLPTPQWRWQDEHSRRVRDQLRAPIGNRTFKHDPNPPILSTAMTVAGANGASNRNDLGPFAGAAGMQVALHRAVTTCQSQHQDRTNTAAGAFRRTQLAKNTMTVRGLQGAHGRPSV